MAETYDRIISMLNDMDAEDMPNERRAAILAGVFMVPTGLGCIVCPASSYAGG